MNPSGRKLIMKITLNTSIKTLIEQEQFEWF